MKSISLILAAAGLAAALLASGCSAPQLDSGRIVTQKNVMGNIWERYEYWPREENPMRVKEGASEHAQAFCGDQRMEFQPLESAITRGEKDESGKLVRGASATLRFRCLSGNYSPMD